MNWIVNNLGLIGGLTLEHLRLSVVPIVLGFVIAIPLGWVAWRYRVTRGLVLTVAGLTPSSAATCSSASTLCSVTLA